MIDFREEKDDFDFREEKDELNFREACFNALNVDLGNFFLGRFMNVFRKDRNSGEESEEKFREEEFREEVCEERRRFLVL